MSGTQTDDTNTTTTTQADETKVIEGQAAETTQQEDQTAKPAEGSEDDKQQTPEQQEEAKAAKKPWYERRISDLTRQRYDRDARIRELETQLEAARNGFTQTDLPKTPEEFAALAEKLSEEKASKKFAQVEFDRACNDVYNTGKAEYDDFDTVLGAFIPLGGLTPALIESALATDAPHKVLYHLGKHPEEAYRVMQQSPTRQVADLVKLAVKLSAPPPAKPVSKAPKPIPVGARGTGASAPVDPDKMSMADWVKWRDKELEEKRKR